MEMKQLLRKKASGHRRVASFLFILILAVLIACIGYTAAAQTDDTIKLIEHHYIDVKAVKKKKHTQTRRLDSSYIQIRVQQIKNTDSFLIRVNQSDKLVTSRRVKGYVYHPVVITNPLINNDKSYSSDGLSDTAEYNILLPAALAEKLLVPTNETARDLSPSVKKICVIALSVLLVLILLYAYRYHSKLAKYYKGREIALEFLESNNENIKDVASAILLFGADKVDFKMPKILTNEVVGLIKSTNQKEAEIEKSNRCGCCCNCCMCCCICVDNSGKTQTKENETRDQPTTTSEEHTSKKNRCCRCNCYYKHCCKENENTNSNDRISKEKQTG